MENCKWKWENSVFKPVGDKSQEYLEIFGHIDLLGEQNEEMCHYPVVFCELWYIAHVWLICQLNVGKLAIFA